MAKRTNLPPAPESDESDEKLITLAEMLLSEHFFDPDQEREYKQKLAKGKRTGAEPVLLDHETIELPNGECHIRIEALQTWTQFRVAWSHPAFFAAVEGTWSFETEALSRTKVNRTGDSDAIEAAVEAMMDEIEGSMLDGEEFADFIAEDEDDDIGPLIGDDPTEPPEATGLDRNRIKAIAKRMTRKPDADIDIEDRTWLEQTPQSLPVIAESLVNLANAAKRNEPLILAYQLLLSLQLEFVRYRQDRGWEWANEMIAAFQQRLIALGRESGMPQDDWFMMCNALSQSRVPVSDSVQAALADAGFKSEDVDVPAEQMLGILRGFMDELAEQVSSPFEVIQGLESAGPISPSMVRGFMATELALSPHRVLRDAVPLMLLDDDSTVRRNAAAALEQTAHPDAMSPESLRRAITLRNWIPAADRPSLDAAIRKARLAGVPIGIWPTPSPDLEFHASAIDGSGAQSILVASRTGKKGFFGGILMRHGTGVVDIWADPDLSRSKISKLLREAQMSAPHIRVDSEFVAMLVQHAIGTAVERQTAPPALLLEMAEILGGTEWKDRRLDVKAEAERLFALLDPNDRTPEGIENGFARGMSWIPEDEVFTSWYEDGPQVQQALAKLPRTDRSGMTAAIMTEVLPDRRAEWAERSLLMALWLQASHEVERRSKARDLALVAHALVGDMMVEKIPLMAVIASQTVRAALLGAW